MEDMRGRTLWVNEAPARIGDGVDDVDTPALLLDLDVFERNLQAMDRLLAGSPVRLRRMRSPTSAPTSPGGSSRAARSACAARK